MDAILDAMAERSLLLETRLWRAEAERDAAEVQACSAGSTAALLRLEIHDRKESQARGIEAHKLLMASMQKKQAALQAELEKVSKENARLEERLERYRPRVDFGSLLDKRSAEPHGIPRRGTLGPIANPFAGGMVYDPKAGGFSPQ